MGGEQADRVDQEGERGFDVFLSHSSVDKAAVQRIAENLRNAGLRPWFDGWALAPGDDWQREIAAGLRASRAGAVLVGPTDLGGWASEEVRVALDVAVNDRSFRLFAVLLPGVPDPFDSSALPPFLSTRTWVDLRAGVGSKRAVQALINAVKGLPFEPSRPRARDNTPPPYRGLRAFDEADAEFFFGREADVQRLLEKLKRSSFLAVIGPSGSGKSSLARAGLVSAIRAGALPGSETWTIEVLKPGARPLDTLTAALGALYPHLAGPGLLDTLARDTRALRIALARPPAAHQQSARVLWLVDQFEEIFTLCHDEPERQAFVDNLLDASAAGGLGAVVLTMRADFYARCAAHPTLAQRLSASQFLVGPLTRQGLEHAIEEPARRVGLELEAGLVDTIREDVEHQPGTLPLLQHALLELWQRRRGSLLTLEAYRASGGVEGALAKRADAVWSSFVPAQREITRRVLLRLTQPGEGAEDTRRRASLDELVTRQSERPNVENVVAALADARLLTTTGDDIVDVAHEALIRGWPRLRRWVEEDREGLRVHRRLTDATQDWQEHGNDPGSLYRGARLAEALEWRAAHDDELNDVERTFLDASHKAQRDELEQARRRTRRLRALAAALGLLLVAAVIGIAVAVDRTSEANAQRDKANAQERRAIAERRTASARAVAFAAVAQLDNRLDLALLLSLESYHQSGGAEARSALVSALQRSGTNVGVLRGPAKPFLAVGFLPSGRAVATLDETGLLQLWNLQGRRIGPPIGVATSVVDNRDALRLISFSHDGRLMAVGGELWSLQTRRRVPGSPRADKLAFDGTGRQLAGLTTLGSSFDAPKRVEVRNPRSGRILRSRTAGADLAGDIAVRNLSSRMRRSATEFSERSPRGRAC